MRSGCCEVVWFRVGRMVAIGFSGVMHTLGCIYVSLEAESRAWRQSSGKSDASHQFITQAVLPTRNYLCSRKGEAV